MADQSLLMLINEVRGKTLKRLEGVSEQEARYAPPGLNNTILWHAGHALVVAEHMAAAPASGRAAELPEGWFEIFSWKSRPATVKSWPALAEVIGRLREQQGRIVSAVEALSEQQLSQVVGDPSRGRTLRYSILHGLHDEANHQGEIWLLRKLQAAREEAGHGR